MASPDAGFEGLTNSSEALGTIIFGVTAGLAWFYRFFSGRKEPRPVPSMSFEQAFSTPTDDLHKQTERCAEALEEILAVIRTLLSEQEKAKEEEKQAALVHRLDEADIDRRVLMKMIEDLKAEIARHDRRDARAQDA